MPVSNVEVGYWGEERVRENLERQGFSVLRLFRTEKPIGKVFEREKVAEIDETLADILYELNNEGNFLPDFLVHKDGKFSHFVEVKVIEGLTLRKWLKAERNNKQKKAMKYLSEKGYEVEVRIVGKENLAEEMVERGIWRWA